MFFYFNKPHNRYVMKKLTLLITITFLALSATVFARKITIKATNYQFTPSTVNAIVGDTIIFKWGNGSHTTTLTSVPAGAATWDKKLDSAHKSFRYILTVAGTYNYKCKPHAASGMKGIINVFSTFAAQFSNFTINDNSANPVLNWKMTSTAGAAYFSVQRSTDGNKFSEIARVNPNNFNLYSYKDNNVIRERFMYYQVEMVDVKGNRQLSSIQLFTNRQAAAARLITSLSPNPIARPGHLMLQFNADKDGVMQARLYNQSGVMVNETKLSAIKGLNNGHIHMGDLAPGTYYIMFTLGDVTEKHAVIMK